MTDLAYLKKRLLLLENAFESYIRSNKILLPQVYLESTDVILNQWRNERLSLNNEAFNDENDTEKGW